MPHIVVHHSGTPDARLSRATVALVTDLTERVLAKRPEVMAIAIQYIDDHDWFIGGESLADLGRSAFHLDISITDETNTKAEKARYVREMHAGMRGLLNDLRRDLHDVSYVHLIDARATAYGYGGLTQEYRHQQAGV